MLWTWQECEDYASSRGDVSIVDDGSAAAYRRLRLSAGSAARYECEAGGRGPWTVSLRYRCGGSRPGSLVIAVAGLESLVEYLPSIRPNRWLWVSVPAKVEDGKVAVELCAEGEEFDVDGFFVRDEPLGLPKRVGDLDAMIGAKEAEDLSALRERFPVLSPPRANVEMVSLAEIAREAAGPAWPVLQSLAQKPPPYIVNAHDVGPGTDYNADYSWHALDKEKRWDLPGSGMLGVVNPNTDIYLAVGLGLAGEAVTFHHRFRPVLHLANFIVYEVDVADGLTCEVAFMCCASDTVLVSVYGRSSSGDGLLPEVTCLVGKDPLENPPSQRYKLPGQLCGAGVTTTTGAKVWTGDAPGWLDCFYEWVRGRSDGRRLLVMQGTGFSSLSADAERPCRFAVNFHRFALEDAWNPELMPELYPKQTEQEAANICLRACEDALSVDLEEFVKRSIEPYRALPRVMLPVKSWEADFYSCLELPRASTFSPLGSLETRFYNFCRVHAHEPFGWWSYGMHAHEDLCTLFTNITDPALSADFLRGHLRHQREDGMYPYGVNHTVDPYHGPENATAPLIVWEAWQSYLWSGDREFLREAYESGKRNQDWWLRERDRCGEGLCHWLNTSLESVRDDDALPTWQVTGGSQYQEPLDLNCYLLVQEQTLSLMADELGLSEEGERYRRLAERRAKAMNAHMWHEGDRCYYGIGEVVPCWAAVKDISTFLPLWAGLAPEGRFEPLVRLATDPETFGLPYGPPTLAGNEPGFGPKKHWFGGNWVEMSLFPVLGLKRYGYYQLAVDLACRNTKMVFDELEKYGHFREYFDSIEGSGTDLIDYIWTAMPAHFILNVFFGIEPTAEGLLVLPALPRSWSEIRIENLHVRGRRVSVNVHKDGSTAATFGALDSKQVPVIGNRGVLVLWDDLPDGVQIEIVQPPCLTETYAAPPEAPRDWSDVPSHEYPDDEELVRTVRARMKTKAELA